MKFKIYKDSETNLLYAKRLLFFGLIEWTVGVKHYYDDSAGETCSYKVRIEDNLRLGLYTKLRKHYGIVRKDKFVETMTIT
jgi:hypothetical protein